MLSNELELEEMWWLEADETYDQHMFILTHE